ncbi:helix-turn-helix domain-containing protein [Soonwooa sp.]|uniref:helix-turn-helix domain-containing protein n=1 Tax=Soonwooa sp. TaxID=1938592 RepID=UPI00261B2435|nr:helix-turn-helix domain-containing protein [Soonwooa sp.]
MLSYSQDNYEKALSYLTLGQGKYQEGDFVKSVKLLEKARNFAATADTLNLQGDVYMTLIPAYRRAGLISQSDDGFEKLKLISQKLKNYDRKLYLLYCEAKMYDIDKDFCKAAQKRREFINLLQPVSPDKEVDNRYKFSVFSQLCYVEIKCGNIPAARKTFAEAEAILNQIDKKTPVKLVEFYYMDKALLNVIDQDKASALENFTKATDEVVGSGNNIVIKDILTERLNANVDTPENQMKFSKMEREISDSETTVAKELTYIEAIKNKKEIENEARKKRIYIWIAISSIFLLITGVTFYWYRNRRLKSKYLKIIEELKTNETSKVSVISVNGSEKELITSDIIKNDNTEREILKKLEAFEKKKLYNTKGISMAQMAVMLKTNTKYLSHVLRKYRNSDFYNYINDCRIDFIVRELHDNPQLLQYKIAALSEMCGYSSHSQFTSIFKMKKGMSPSQFINFIQKDQV